MVPRGSPKIRKSQICTCPWVNISILGPLNPNAKHKLSKQGWSLTSSNMERFFSGHFLLCRRRCFVRKATSGIIVYTPVTLRLGRFSWMSAIPQSQLYNYRAQGTTGSANSIQTRENTTTHAGCVSSKGTYLAAFRDFSVFSIILWIYWFDLHNFSLLYFFIMNNKYEWNFGMKDKYFLYLLNIFMNWFTWDL